MFLDCWFLSGPTAGGKTRVGIELARLLGAEILSLDSMAVYRGMDVGAAKPTAEERAAARHHLLDLADPQDDFSVAEYLDAARAQVAEIRQRGREALFVGGTPLYLKALLRGIFAGPKADWNLRRELQAIAAGADPEALHRRLAEVDPDAARRLPPGDARRIIRAIEVFELTGQPISEAQRQFDHAEPAESLRVFVLDWPRDQLVARIDARVEAMFAGGLLDEARRMLDAQQPPGRTALQAIGYHEAMEHLSGRLPLADAIAVVKTRTRRFAKRQMTWFRSLSECRFVKVSEPLDAAEVAKRIHEQGAR